MSYVRHLVLPGRMRSSCGFNVFESEIKRIATTLDDVTCEACKRTWNYRDARRRNSA